MFIQFKKSLKIPKG